MSEQTRQRISGLSAILLVSLAGITDIIQFFADLTGFGAIVAMMLGATVEIGLLVWFRLLGIQYFNKNVLLKFGTILATSVITFIPFLDMLPELTLGTIVLIMITRYEDSAKNAKGTGSHLAGKTLGAMAPEAKIALRAANLRAAGAGARDQIRQARVEKQQKDLEARQARRARSEQQPIPS
ncbi:MAG: hypothetical protein AAB472_00095 [Patescibacteria group bacterium]